MLRIRQGKNKQIDCLTVRCTCATAAVGCKNYIGPFPEASTSTSTSARRPWTIAAAIVGAIGIRTGNRCLTNVLIRPTQSGCSRTSPIIFVPASSATIAMIIWRFDRERKRPIDTLDLAPLNVEQSIDKAVYYDACVGHKLLLQPTRRKSETPTTSTATTGSPALFVTEWTAGKRFVTTDNTRLQKIIWLVCPQSSARTLLGGPGPSPSYIKRKDLTARPVAVHYISR